jgi:hypothetical protein
MFQSPRPFPIVFDATFELNYTLLLCGLCLEGGIDGFCLDGGVMVIDWFLDGFDEVLGVLGYGTIGLFVVFEEIVSEERGTGELEIGEGREIGAEVC